MLSIEPTEKKSDRQIDPHFRVEVIRAVSNPQQVIYAAMHQDYSEGFVFDELHLDKEVWKKSDSGWNPTDCFVTEWDGPSEKECGDRIVKHLLAGNRGHYGCIEHPQIVFNCGWLPHSVMQQMRTHRVGISFDCQSMRYTGKRIIEAAEGSRDIEEVFYLRPIGTYTDRQGKHYEYGTDHREWHKSKCLRAAQDYHMDIQAGLSEEHARGLIPFDVRQHWVMSANARSLMHLLDLRFRKLDAQLEARQLCELIWPHFEAWCPQIAEWYLKNRAGKSRLAP